MLSALLLALWLILPASADDWVRIIIAVSSGCGIGLLAIAWATVQYGKKVWLSIAGDFVRTDAFEKAVIRSAAETIRLAVKEHDEQDFPHGVWRHDVLVVWQTAIEARLWKLERKQPD